MNEHATWSLHLGRWGGVHVRVHMFFLLFGVLTLLLSWPGESGSASAGVNWWIAVKGLCVLFAAVLLHELGHVWTAFRQGGYVEEIVIGPLGGLGAIHGITEPRGELLAHLGGPLANLLVCAMCAPFLLAGNQQLGGLLSPLAPEDITVGGAGMVCVKLAFWINWLLMLVNLFPAFPFDGGRVLRAAILLRWPHFGRRGALLIVTSLAKFMAVTIFVSAFMLKFEGDQGLLPTRFALILLAIFLFFSAKQEESRGESEPGDEAGLDGHVFSRAYASQENRPQQDGPAASKPFSQWLEHRRALKLQRQRELEAEEERRVDEILARLHQHGKQSLSSADLALLERVSARYRNRLRN